MTVLLDTSVLVAAFTPDLHTEAAERLLLRSERFLVSDWAAAEFSSAVRIKVRQGIVREDGLENVEAAFDGWVRSLGGRQRLSADDAVQARAMIVRRAGLRAPDALHIAIAVRLSATLATFDDRQANVAGLESIPVLVR